MLKARLIKYICQQWITPALGPKLIGSQEEEEETFDCTMRSKEGTLFNVWTIKSIQG